MELNRLETALFADLLNLELGVPVNATTCIKGSTFSLVLVPHIDSQGFFTFDYFQATTGAPDVNRDGSIGVGLGMHKELSEAWRARDVFSLEVTPSPYPLRPERTTALLARVLHAEIRNRGRLVLKDNIVGIRSARLSRAKFSIVDFFDFTTAEKQSHRRIVLNSDCGWTITIPKDHEETRGIVSHTGLVEKSNGDEFNEEELLDVLEALKYFLAFTAGSYCHYTAVVSYGPERKPVWGQIGKFERERQYFTNWFNNNRSAKDGVILETLFRGYMRRWQVKKMDSSPR